MVSVVSKVSEVSLVSEVSVVLMPLLGASRVDGGETVRVGEVVWCWWAGLLEVITKHLVAGEAWLGHLRQGCPLMDCRWSKLWTGLRRWGHLGHLGQGQCYQLICQAGLIGGDVKVRDAGGGESCSLGRSCFQYSRGA